MIYFRTLLLGVLLALASGSRFSMILFQISGNSAIEVPLLMVTCALILSYPTFWRSIVAYKNKYVIIPLIIVLLVSFFSLSLYSDLDLLDVYKEARNLVFLQVGCVLIYSLRRDESTAKLANLLLIAFCIANILFSELSYILYRDVPVLSWLGGIRVQFPSLSLLLLQYIAISTQSLVLTLIPPFIALLFFAQGFFRLNLLIFFLVCIPILFAESKIFLRRDSRFRTLLSRALLILLPLALAITVTLANNYFADLLAGSSISSSKHIQVSLDRVFTNPSESSDSRLSPLKFLLNDVDCLLFPHGYGVFSSNNSSFSSPYGSYCLKEYPRYSDDSTILYFPHAYGIVASFVAIFWYFLTFIPRPTTPAFFLRLWLSISFLITLLFSADPFVLPVVALESGLILGLLIPVRRTLENSVHPIQ